MVCCDGFVRSDNRGETPGEEHDFFEKAVVDGGSRETDDVLKGRFGPVVDDVEGEDGGADWVEPPDV